MTPAWKNTAFRLPDELLAQIDAYAARLARETGLDVTRADAARKLLTMALEAANAKPKKRKK